MRGFLDIDGVVEPFTIHPGPRLPDGRRIGIEEGQLIVDNQRHDIAVLRDGAVLWVKLSGRTHRVELCDAVAYLADAADGGLAGGIARAPMPGLVVSVAAAVGNSVQAGDPMLVIESMKLETTIVAGIDGTITAIHFAPGESFDRDAVLAEIQGAS
ncbi:acetyl-CoA carboxylase biotin carboxyl carrier protein subunit [Sphingopyxis sp.]|uniref:acetyl-CoA carboxylase biotin carboxyl carrier protein subunit n=1 Tax=Sphingopyxis sp. TaxID=1908224 RepID=UPI003D0FA229